jgi:Fe-S cluster assembly ATP-binding protein
MKRGIVMELLNIENLTAKILDKTILKNLNLKINTGEIHVIMGPNGAGKSTLSNVIMGHPKYTVHEGNIFFEGNDITEEKTSARARRGIFLSFQNPEEVSGITVENFLRTAKSAVEGKSVGVISFNKNLKENMKQLNMDESYSRRYLNIGFSGGEKKKNEILQMVTLAPKLAILDETDSGLDVDAIKIVSAGISKFKNDTNSILIITHNPRLLETIKPDFIHILVNGNIVETGDVSLVSQIENHGFARYLS